MIKFLNQKLEKLEKGASILMAVLIATMALAVAFGVSSILITLISISGQVRSSVQAFYAADSAMECKLYDVRIEAINCDGFTLSNGATAEVADTILDNIHTIKSIGTFKNTRRGIETRFIMP